MHGHLINVRNTLHRMCSTNIIANAGRHGGQMFSLNSPFKKYFEQSANFYFENMQQRQRLL